MYKYLGLDYCTVCRSISFLALYALQEQEYRYSRPHPLEGTYAVSGEVAVTTPTYSSPTTHHYHILEQVSDLNACNSWLHTAVKLKDSCTCDLPICSTCDLPICSTCDLPICSTCDLPICSTCDLPICSTCDLPVCSACDLQVRLCST